MYQLEKIDAEEMNDFFEAHLQYLVEDEMITTQEDIDYFSSEDEYRQIIRDLMKKPSPVEVFWIQKEGVRIGATHFKIYHLTDGECFILDFWIFPEYRNQGFGKEAFLYLEEYGISKGAKYFKLNSMKADSIRFWNRLGFIYGGKDEDEMDIYIKRIEKVY